MENYGIILQWNQQKSPVGDDVTTGLVCFGWKLQQVN